jgi:2-polyprenyl-3-methyl-5-hydroxy-6-metoxy-1,4-benzoquinol methylase
VAALDAGVSAARRSGSPDESRLALSRGLAYWEKRYSRGGRLWGDGPSELARLAVARLRPAALGESAPLTLLDAGCGYGRDSRYLAAELGCRVLGVDPSPAAIAIACETPRGGLDVEYTEIDVAALAEDPGQAGRFDVVFAWNVFHLLQPGDRREFAAAVAQLVRPGGLLFLNTLSPRDPEHYAVGEAVRGEERSWVDRVYLHFCTAEELVAAFVAFDVLDLEERSYDEANVGDVVHRHAAWFLEGRRRRA